jgi:hypothetical protein
VDFDEVLEGIMFCKGNICMWGIIKHYKPIIYAFLWAVIVLFCIIRLGSFALIYLVKNLSIAMLVVAIIILTKRILVRSVAVKKIIPVLLFLAVLMIVSSFWTRLVISNAVSYVLSAGKAADRECKESGYCPDSIEGWREFSSGKYVKEINITTPVRAEYYTVKDGQQFILTLSWGMDNGYFFTGGVDCSFGDIKTSDCYSSQRKRD